MRKRMGGKGGTLCRFHGGEANREPQRASALHRKPQAVRQGRQEGVWMNARLPEILTEAAYPVMVRRLCQYAGDFRGENIIGHKAKAESRTFYGAILGFETSVSTGQAKQMIAQVARGRFPEDAGRAFLFTEIRAPARACLDCGAADDGGKSIFRRGLFGRLDEQWNRIYSRAMDRDEQEHLLKKWETERYKQLMQRGQKRRIEKTRAGRASLEPGAF